MYEAYQRNFDTDEMRYCGTSELLGEAIKLAKKNCPKNCEIIVYQGSKQVFRGIPA